MWEYAFVKNHQIVQLKCMHFLNCRLHFSKAILKKWDQNCDARVAVGCHRKYFHNFLAQKKYILTLGLVSYILNLFLYYKTFIKTWERVLLCKCEKIRHSMLFSLHILITPT